jgi:AraC-like DNA-binding protein
MREWLFTLPAFYAEFAPLDRHSQTVDHLYVLKDCGLLAAPSKSVFASPFRSVAFTFPAEDATGAGRVRVYAPTFGHRKRKRAFHGWAFGVRSNPVSAWPAAADRPPFAECLARLAQIVSPAPASAAILKILDRFLDEEAEQAQLHWSEAASRLGGSRRTLQRKVKTSTGLSPKQLLSVERFERAVHDVSAPHARLAHVAGDLRFADQAHLTREFRRHAGLSPGAFQKTRAVRFFQDSDPACRLRLAAWSSAGSACTPSPF